MRQAYLADILLRKGFSVSVYALCEKGRTSFKDTAASLEEVLKDADMIAAPLPFLRSGSVVGSREFSDLTEANILRYAKKGSVFFAGGIPEAFRKQAQTQGIRCVDYMRDEYVAMQNTIAATEGVLAEAIGRSPQNLYKSNCLVLGYGRCGSTLVSYLKKFACHVTVYEKEKTAAARAAVTADRVIESAELPHCLKEAQYIFNTVPSLVLPKAMLGYVSGDVLILDLAAAPGGVDYEAARQMGIEAVLLSGLPGKYAPLSSAEILAEAVWQELKKQMKKENQSFVLEEQVWN